MIPRVRIENSWRYIRRKKINQKVWFENIGENTGMGSRIQNGRKDGENYLFGLLFDIDQ